MYLKDFQTNISSLFKDVKIKVKVNDSYVDGNEEFIFANIIKNRFRLVDPYVKQITLIVLIENFNQSIGFSIISEFPYCCGKAVLYGISLRKTYYTGENAQDQIEISDENYSKIVSLYIDLVKKICVTLCYSSLNFIISQKEQPSIHEALENLGIKPINTFKNQRMSLKNICHDYLINLEF